MLELIRVRKEYRTKSETVEALKGIDLNFRKSEFVSVLGPSGCGKTTLLNLIGGLDQYTSGELKIGGVSTRDFSDSDWDAYRNHSVGFVFQSYNLIPHQSVLANVELALTLSGVSKSERRKRAVSALEKVGLKDQIKKKPNQMSGGQMQRVAIARALVNDPEILLADEPTGALDTKTSVQIMELLKEIAKEKLVIMVTHNPDLAETYSTRIIRLLDGKVTSDSDPFDGSGEEIADQKKQKKAKKPSMSFFTALALSMNNLLTKKGRTILTAFAGSIGIIGIALILSLSNGINSYIYDVQEDALSSTPIRIRSETRDMTEMITAIMGANQRDEASAHELDAVYSSDVMAQLMNTVLYAETKTNNLTLFKEFLDQNGGNINDYASDIRYEYDLPMKIYTTDPDGSIVLADLNDLMMRIYEKMGIKFAPLTSAGTSSSGISGLSGMNSSAFSLFQEMLPGKEGELISPLLKDQYDLVSGSWPQTYNEIVLIVDEKNEISDVALGALGFRSADDLYRAIQNGKDASASPASFSFEDLTGKEYRLIPAAAFYHKNADGTYLDLSETERGIDLLYGSDKAITLRISGIIRKNSDAVAAMLTGSVGYTAELTRTLMESADQFDVVKDQIADPGVDVFTGLPFRSQENADPGLSDMLALLTEYASKLSDDQKAAMYVAGVGIPSSAELEDFIQKSLASSDRSSLEEQILAAYHAQEISGIDTSYLTEYVQKMSDEELFKAVREVLTAGFIRAFQERTAASYSSVPAEQLAALLQAALDPENEKAFSGDVIRTLFEEYIPGSSSSRTLQENKKALGIVDADHPSSILLYVKTFADKDKVNEIIRDYNNSHEKDDQISYTDLMGLMMSAMSTIINAISYVLIAFAAISLVVSSIMIGIITYISVLERTKEIGILRAIGASKRDIARVFNAETMIEGFASGVMGILVTLLLILPINAIIRHLSGISAIGAILPPVGALILVAISVLLTLIAGLIPSRIAAKKDPVLALSAE